MKATRTKKNSLFTKLWIFIFAAYAVVALVTLQIEINTKRNDLGQVNLQIEAQQLQISELERQVALGDNEAYLARIARDKLDMGFSDEHVYQDVSGT